MKKYSRNETGKSLLVAIAIGLIAGLAVTLLGSVFTTIMVMGNRWDESAYQTASFIIWILATFLDCTLCSIIKKEQIWLCVLLTAALYAFVLLAMNILFFDGVFNTIGKGILAILIGAIPAYFVFGLKSKSPKRKFRYRS